MLLFSFVPVILLASTHMPGANWPDAVALMAMHVAAWAVCVTMLTRLGAIEKR